MNVGISYQTMYHELDLDKGVNSNSKQLILASTMSLLHSTYLPEGETFHIYDGKQVETVN